MRTPELRAQMWLRVLENKSVRVWIMLWEQVCFSPQNQKSSIECERTRKHVTAHHAGLPAAVETSPRVLRMLDRLFSCADIPKKMTNSRINEELKRTDGAGEDVMRGRREELHISCILLSCKQPCVHRSAIFCISALI